MEENEARISPLTPPDEPVDPAIQHFVGQSVAYYVQCVFSEANAAEPVIKRMKTATTNLAAKRLNLAAGLVNTQPATLLVGALEKEIALLTEQKSHPSEISQLRELLNRAKAGEIVFPKSEIVADQDFLKYIKENYAISQAEDNLAEDDQEQETRSTFSPELLAGRLYLGREVGFAENGVEVTVPLEEEQLVTAEIILLPGTMTTIHVGGEFNESMVPPVYKEDDSGYKETYPPINGVFYYDNVAPNKPEKRSITLLPEIPGLRATLGKFSLNKTLRDSWDWPPLNGKLDEITKERLLAIFYDHGEFRPEDIASQSLADVLLEVANVVDNLSSGEIQGRDEEGDIEDLITQIETKGGKDGACISTSVLTAGIVEALGLPARTLGGDIIYPDTNTRGGHQWCEVYIPKLSKWVPIDSSMNVFFTYPSSDILYALSGYIYAPKPDDKPSEVKLTVDQREFPVRKRK